MEAEAELSERMCIVTRECREEDLLIRFARSPQGEAIPDLKRKLPGRGVWVSLNRTLVAEAAGKNLFSRGFGQATKAAPDMAETVSSLLRRNALSYLSLAKKAGEAVAGFTKVEDMLAHGRADILIHALEAAPDGRQKLDRLAGPEVGRIEVFGVAELDLAFGRSNVIHAAVTKGGLAGKLRAAVRRIEIYDAQPGIESVFEERA